MPELINRDNLYEEDKVIDFLKRRKKYLDGLVITGGEPTLQPDLPEFLRKMKKIGYSIKLDTNGLWPEVVAALIEEGLVDYIAMDIKGPKDSYEKFAGVKAGRIEETIKLIMGSALPYEFRSTLVKGLHTGEDIKLMAELIEGAELYYLQNYGTSDPLAGPNFKGRSFTPKELNEFRQLVNTQVKNCLIR